MSRNSLRASTFVLALATAACAERVAAPAGPAPDAAPSSAAMTKQESLAVAAYKLVMDETLKFTKPEVLFLLDRVCADAGESNVAFECTMPISEGLRHGIHDEFADRVTVEFVADQETVLDGQGWVRDDGIFASLGPVPDAKRVKVGYNWLDHSTTQHGELVTLERDGDGWAWVSGEGVSGSFGEV